MKRNFIVAIALSFLFVGAVCADNGHSKARVSGDAYQASDTAAPVAFDKKPAPGTKAKCPVMGGVFKVNEKTEMSQYKGKYYAFCCPGCKPKFDKNPKQYLK